MPDLFGFNVPEDRALTPLERKKLTRKTPKAKGYAWTPGSGPAGETCKSCQHIVRTRSGSGKTFIKCGLMKAHWTHGPGSDIRASAAACRNWESAKP